VDDVASNDVAGWLYPARGEHAEDPGAAPDVQHARAGHQGEAAQVEFETKV